MPDLSVIIPARNERWLSKTIEDVLSHIEADTEVIAVLDGAWSEPGIPQHERVTVVYLPESIGQRAATNLGARLSTATYVMKLDAHCAVAQGFDRVLIEAAKELGPDVTQIPSQRNLHVFDRVCACGKREYQGPTTVPCVSCGETNWTIDVVWNPNRRRTDYWTFDSTPKFQYAGEMGKRPEYQGEIVDVMSSLGACFFMARERFWQLGGLDEAHGSWGNFGVEVACKSWLSGGRQVVNKRTWFSHMFRTQGLDFGFPYAISGSEQERARAYSRDLWFNNKWPGQVRPLRWLVEKFWPVPSWTQEQLEALPLTLPTRPLGEQSGLPVGAEATQISLISGSEPRVGVFAPDIIETKAQDALFSFSGTDSERQFVASDAVSLAGLTGSDAVAPHDVVVERDQFQVGGITAPLIATDDVIQLQSAVSFGQSFNEPCIQKPMDILGLSSAQRDITVGVSSFISDGSYPVPASSGRVDDDLGKDASELFAVEMGNDEILSGSHASSSNDDVRSGAGRADTRSVPPILPSKSIIYYSDGRIDPSIALPCRASIERSGLPVVAVTLQPIHWPYATNVVVPIERGYAAMFKQILIGLLVAPSDVVYFAEHDLIYDVSHWSFTPPSDAVYFYNTNWVKVDAYTGRAVSYISKQTSQLCAYRRLLIEHYQTRVARVEREGFSRKVGFEPGSHNRPERIDNVMSDVWRSPAPNYDIRHRHCLTPSRWNRDQFRSQRNCEGWQESRVNIEEIFGVQQAFA